MESSSTACWKKFKCIWKSLYSWEAIVLQVFSFLVLSSQKEHYKIPPPSIIIIKKFNSRISLMWMWHYFFCNTWATKICFHLQHQCKCLPPLMIHKNEISWKLLLMSVGSLICKTHKFLSSFFASVKCLHGCTRISCKWSNVFNFISNWMGWQRNGLSLFEGFITIHCAVCNLQEW